MKLFFFSGVIQMKLVNHISPLMCYISEHVGVITSATAEGFSHLTDRK